MSTVWFFNGHPLHYCLSLIYKLEKQNPVNACPCSGSRSRDFDRIRQLEILKPRSKSHKKKESIGILFFFFCLIRLFIYGSDLGFFFSRVGSRSSQSRNSKSSLINIFFYNYNISLVNKIYYLNIAFI